MSFIVRAKSTTLYLLASLFVLVGLAVLAPRAQTAMAPDAARLLTARAGHTATALTNGTVLVAGGITRTGSISNIEFLDAESSQSKEGPRLLQARGFHTATVLADGRVLLAGGRNQGKPLASSEIYDPVSSSISAGPSLGKPRAGHTATLLANGRVLIAGGDANATAEIYDPSSNSFIAIANSNVARTSHAAIRLTNGNVLLVGGRGSAAATAEIFDAVSMRFTPVRDGLKTARVSPDLKLLPDGKVQVFGGDAETTMELFNPAGYFSSRGHLLRDSSSILPVLHSPARGALVGLWNSETAKYQRSALGSMSANLERTAHTITSLPGKDTVVIVGGASREGKALDSVVTMSECTATVTTDLTDYTPGQTVTMSGSGWLPGEQISLNLHRDTNNPPDTVLSATADASGNWTNAEYVVLDLDGGVTFVLTATGDSGCTAQTTFTDSVGLVAVVVGAQAPNPVTAGSSAAYSVLVDFNGAGSTGCIATLSTSAGAGQTGLPAGTSAIFGTSPVSGIGNPAGDASTTLTINTTAVTTPNGTYTFTVSATAPAVSGGQGCQGGTVNAAVTLQVGSSTAATTTTLGSSLNPSTYGDGVTFTATVLAGVTQVTTGTVTFIEGGSCTTPTATLQGPTGLSVSGQASFSTSILNAGLHTLRACYNGASGFTASSGILAQTVGQATPTVTASAGAGNPYTYDTLAHEGSCTVTGVGGADLGPLDATHTLVDPPVDAGTYTVHCDYLGTTNYAAASDTESLTINQATPTVTASAGAGNPYTYDTTSHEGSCTVTGVGGADLGSLDATHTLVDPPVDAGTYTVHCDYLGSTNYAAASDTESLTINQATPTVTASAGAGNPYTYDTTSHEGSCTVTGVGGADLGPLDATHTPTDPPVDAGSYTVNCDYLGSTNYAAASDTESLTINQATPTVTASAGAGNPYTYDGDPHVGECSVTGVGGADIGPLTPSHTPTDPPVDAGSYTVNCDYLGSTNYTAASDAESLTISQATPTVIASAGAGNPYTYDGDPHVGECSVTGVGGADIGPLAPTHTPTDPPVDAGSYTVNCDYLGSTNYTASSDTESLTINQATPTVTASAGVGNPYTYDTAAHEGSCTVTGVGGADLGSLDATHTPTDPPVNAGSYTVNCDYLGSSNYAAASDTESLTINQATPTVTASAGAGNPYTYDTVAHEGSCTVTGVGGVDLGLLDASHTPTDPPTNAGSYTVHCDYLGSTNYAAASDTESLTINQATPTVTASAGAGNPYAYNTFAHEGSCTVTGVGGANLGPLDATHTPADPPVNAGSYTVHCDYLGSTNYAAASDTESLTINQATPTVTASAGAGNPYTFNALAHEGNCTVTGVGGADLGPLDATHTPADPPVNAGSYTVHCDYPGSTNYVSASDTESLTIKQATPTVTASAGAGNPYTYDTFAHEGSCTVTGVGGVDLGPLDATHTPVDPPVNAGTYTVKCNYPGSTNYIAGNATTTLTIGSRDALVNYIGQTTFVTSGSSATTAQVTLSASVQDPTGIALVGAKMDFIDVTDGFPGKALATNVTVTGVPNSPANTGTANKIVTLSTGQYGAESYLILVRMTGNYDNTDQSIDDKTAVVVVAKPAIKDETIGAGTIAALATAAGLFPGNGSDVSFTIGMKYNKSGANLQGRIFVMVPQADGMLVVKSTSLSSMAIKTGTPKTSTVYTKASISKVLNNGSSVAIDGNATLRLDVSTGTGDKVGFTVMSSKDSTLYYSNQWVLVGTTWKTDYENFKTGAVVIN